MPHPQRNLLEFYNKDYWVPSCSRPVWHKGFFLQSLTFYGTTFLIVKWKHETKYLRHPVKGQRNTIKKIKRQKRHVPRKHTIKTRTKSFPKSGEGFGMRYRKQLKPTPMYSYQENTSIVNAHTANTIPTLYSENPLLPMVTWSKNPIAPIVILGKQRSFLLFLRFLRFLRLLYNKSSGILLPVGQDAFYKK